MSVGATIQYDFHDRPDTVTGRTWRQLTYGTGYTYPLYFYGGTVTADSKTLIYYHWLGDELQNWKLDLDSGVATQLTDVQVGDCHHWRLINKPHAERGVMDQMSTFNSVTNELVYFAGQELRGVHLETLADRLIHKLPEDRYSCAIPGISPDGTHLAMIHIDYDWWKKARANGLPKRYEAKDCHLDVIELTTGERRNVLVMDAWLSHANFIDNETIVFSNPPTESGTYVTPITGGYVVQVSVPTTPAWKVNHAHVTARGIQYETVSPGEYGVMGEVDPHTYVNRQFRTDVPIHHRGRDVEGKLCVADSYRMEPPYNRFICWFPELHADKLNANELLTEDFITYGDGQQSHIHPSLLPNREQLLFTGPNHSTKTNHMFLLGVSDLANRETLLK